VTRKPRTFRAPGADYTIRIVGDRSAPLRDFYHALLRHSWAVTIAVIAAAFLLVGWYCSRREWYRSRIVVPASAMIACTAIYWTVQRIVV